MKNKYNQLELNSILGNSNSVNSNFAVNLQDPVFLAVTKNKGKWETWENQGDQFTTATNLRYEYEGVKLEKYMIKRPSFAELVRIHLPTKSPDDFQPPYT